MNIALQDTIWKLKTAEKKSAFEQDKKNSIIRDSGLHLEKILQKKDELFSTRKEFKFIIPLDKLSPVINFLQQDFFCSHFGEDFIFKYHNIYFDSSDFKFFRLHSQGKYNRIKIRTREYKNGAINKFLECKRKVKGAKIKKERQRIISDNLDLIPSFPFIKKELKKYNLKPSDLKNKTEISYDRINFVSKDFKKRVTLDFDIWAQKNSKKVPIAANFFILEVKSEKFPKKIVQFLLRNYKIKEEKFSKYCVSLCVLEKNLKRNKWKTILKKYF